MNKFKLTFLIILFVSLLSSRCNSRGKRGDNNKQTTENNSGKVENIKTDSTSIINDTVVNVIYYLENSGSMFGYVSTPTEYVQTVTELSSKSEFIDDLFYKEYFFVNGRNPLNIIKIGSNSKDLIYKLNPTKTGYNQGKVATSDLNEMFNLSLNKAGKNGISILISDGIYDIQKSNAPYNALATEGQVTKENFIKRLNKGDIETILIKLKSKFKGKYYFVTKFKKTGRQKYKVVNQYRPFYVWIFGDAELLNKYFSDEYIQTLPGYQNFVRFIKTGKLDLPYEIVNDNKVGKFDFDRNDKHHIENVSIDSRRGKFQFAVNVDFSKIPFSDSYLSNPYNYKCSSNYKIEKIIPLNYEDDKTHNYSHQIIVSSKNSPYGKLNIHLLNKLPDWLEKSNMDNEDINYVPEDKTFGFKLLVKGISDAYEYKNKNKYITTFKLLITN